MDKLKLSGIFTAGLLAFQAVALANIPARAEEFDGNDLRDIRLGMAATELEESGYVDLYCAADPKRMLAGWKNWRDWTRWIASNSHANYRNSAVLAR